MINSSNILIYQNGNIKAIFEEYELDKEVVVRKFRHTANIGKNYTKDDFDKLLIDIQNEEE